MLQLQSISLVQFRNYLERNFSFSERIVGICGVNGSGKTNLLDAIYYLSFSRSYFARTDSQNVFHGLSGMRLQGNYLLNNDQIDLCFILRENNKKELLFNQENYKRFSDHIGRLPCVMIAPDDIELISGSSELRRKFIDTLLSQVNQGYLHQLIHYNKVLLQRNSLLKQAAEQGMIDDTVLSILDEQLVASGESLFRLRKEFLTGFLQLCGDIYYKIAGKDDGLSIQYYSQLQSAPFKDLLQSARSKDLALQRTSAGIHKDDLVFYMEQSLFKTEASQGQRKSLLFALKLAEWQTLKDAKGFTPILLLDDVFEKLDEERMNQLLQWVCSDSNGQVFITDTHEERLEKQLAAVTKSFEMIKLTP